MVMLMVMVQAGMIEVLVEWSLVTRAPPRGGGRQQTAARLPLYLPLIYLSGVTEYIQGSGKRGEPEQWKLAAHC